MIEKYGAKPATINLAISAFKAYYCDFMKRRFLNSLKRAKPEIKEPLVIPKKDIKAMQRPPRKYNFKENKLIHNIKEFIKIMREPKENS